LVWELWNVLTQLSATILIAFLIMGLPVFGQLLISLALIGATGLAYRYIHVSPYDQTFAAGANFGSYVDMLLMGKVNSDHWVAINFIPTAAHTIWGVLVGKVLIGGGSAHRKAMTIAVWGVVALLVGYGLNWLGVAPMIKRICTMPYVIASGGWCVLALAVFYWVIDGLGFRWGWWVVAVVGTNSILIYLVAESLAHSWLNPRVGVFVEGGLRVAGVTGPVAGLVNAVVVWALLWGLCYWLYRKRAFVKV
jgi:predicted acyltransferase